jgi:AcrR family transcriptional regulator
VALTQPIRNPLREEKRNELADFAIESLATKGYARTSLRDIAKLSGMSLGRMHYYFESKADLIKYCVARYKQRFVEGLAATITGATSGPELVASFTRGLVEGVRVDGRVHRLWYNLRAEALFDEDMRHAVTDIESSLRALVGQLHRRLRSFGAMSQNPLLDPEELYLVLDALFFRALQRQLDDEDGECRQFGTSLQRVFDRLL